MGVGREGEASEAFSGVTLVAEGSEEGCEQQQAHSRW